MLSGLEARKIPDPGSISRFSAVSVEKLFRLIVLSSGLLILGVSSNCRESSKDTVFRFTVFASGSLPRLSFAVLPVKMLLIEPYR